MRMYVQSFTSKRPEKLLLRSQMVRIVLGSQWTRLVLLRGFQCAIINTSTHVSLLLSATMSKTDCAPAALTTIITRVSLSCSKHNSENTNEVNNNLGVNRNILFRWISFAAWFPDALELWTSGAPNEDQLFALIHHRVNCCLRELLRWS